MPALDTNVLVRFLVGDDSAQQEAARQLMLRCVSQQQTLFIPVTVTLELEWVLRSAFQYKKDAAISTLSDLLSAVELSFESERAVEAALDLYRSGSADFADCLHIALAAQAQESPLWTFDRSASRIAGARLIGSI